MIDDSLAIWHRDCNNTSTSPVLVETTAMTNARALMETTPIRRGFLPEMAELSLLLPNWQMQKLAELAEQQKVSIGEFLRDQIARMSSMSTATRN